MDYLSMAEKTPVMSANSTTHHVTGANGQYKALRPSKPNKYNHQEETAHSKVSSCRRPTTPTNCPEPCPIPKLTTNNGGATPPTTVHLKLTAAMLAQHNENDVESEDSFYRDIRSRAKQDAGAEWKFNLKLDAYEEDPDKLDAWVKSQNSFFKDRNIFKDLEDIICFSEMARSPEFMADVEMAMES